MEIGVAKNQKPNNQIPSPHPPPLKTLLFQLLYRGTHITWKTIDNIMYQVKLV